MDIHNVISSPESEDGVELCSWPDGPGIGESGRGRPRARDSRSLAKAEDLKTLAISGHIGNGSSRSVDLQLFLANRLQEQFPTDGWILFQETWKERVTPLGRRYWEHTASGRRTGDRGCILGLSSPQKADGRDDAATFAGWPSPMAGTPASLTYNEAGNNDSSRKVVKLILRKNGPQDPDCAVHLSQWSTQNGPARLTASGTMLTGSSARMESGGRLSPAHSRWLMNFPRIWDLCAPGRILIGKTFRRKEPECSGDMETP